MEPDIFQPRNNDHKRLARLANHVSWYIGEPSQLTKKIIDRYEGLTYGTFEDIFWKQRVASISQVRAWSPVRRTLLRAGGMRGRSRYADAHIRNLANGQ